MVNVKICGIRRREDIGYVNKYLPDYIGFIFAESRRKVSNDTVKSLVVNLDKNIRKVGVFVNEKIENVLETAAVCCLNTLQIHGDEKPDYIENLRNELKKNKLKSVEIWKAVRVKDKESLSEFKNFSADAFLLDAFVEGSYGGAGKAFDWKLALEAKKYGKIILAGGLNCENIMDAIKIVQPYAVDVSSGVETEGWKDEQKVKSFLNAARETGNV